MKELLTGRVYFEGGGSERMRRREILTLIRPRWTYTAFTRHLPCGCTQRKGTRQMVMIRAKCREHMGDVFYDALNGDDNATWTSDPAIDQYENLRGLGIEGKPS